MAHFKDAWLEHQQRRFMRPDAHRYIRPDAYRFMPPAAPRWLGKEAVRYFWAEPESDRSPKAYDRKYSPDQPRVPAGNPDGGQWTNGAGSSAAGANLHVAGMPRIPGRRPPTSRERSAVYKAVATWLAEKGIAASDAIAKGSWLYYAIPYISSYLDAPKSLEELQDAVATPKTGYDVHHIVEQSSAAEDGYPRQMIDAPDNLARIPTMKHWEINAWYEMKNPDYDYLSPRAYLKGKDWDERRRVGVDALIRFGVLKP